MRLLTRSDFDGLICGTILRYLKKIDSWKFVHPKDMQDGLIEATKNDVLANVPYVEGCAVWFDHHSSEGDRNVKMPDVEGASYSAPSCARIIYDYYGGEKEMPQFAEMIRAVDKVDSADLTVDEIQNPSGWILLGFIMDPRTGLGRFPTFTISNYQLMEKLMVDCGNMGIDEILILPDVVERIKLYNEQNALFKEMLKKYTKVIGNLIVTDLRDAETIYSGNRFQIYANHPEQNVSMWITWGREKKNVAIAIGHSILNKTCQVDIGSLALKYGGGGHSQVGTCQAATVEADGVIEKLIEALK